MEILPSLISADLLNLGKVIKDLDDHCDGYHLDVMDDHFVPNLTWGPMFVEQILNSTELPIHLHLMVQDPEKWVNRVKLRSKDTFIFHYEATKENDRILKLIDSVKVQGYKIGIAINPETEIETIFDYVDNLDHILIMSVNPGFSGQKFIPEVLEKVDSLINQRDSMNLNFKIGMDGGLGKDNIKMITETGVDQIGIASAIFGSGSSVDNIKKLFTY